ncbi:TolC family protein [Geobacter sp.]|uniref:TolC family protein n=1 Tax=Geobacter sp. TaxID=46610 RepID=UPI00262068B5|nr:TolC family protein [Geobacter sp.]
MKSPAITMGLFFLLCGRLYAAETLTPDEALATALKNHPQTIEARANVSVAEARTGMALANYYPQVTIAADWSKGRSFLTPLESIRETEVHTEALYLRQTIYDFGRTAGAVAAARGNRIAATEALAVTRQDVAFRVRGAYYLVLAAEKQVAATRETVAAREAVFRQAEEFFRQGIRAKVDVARAEANLYGARTALIRAENNRELARVELANAMGLPSLEGRPLVEPAVPPAPLPELDKSRREAFTARAELKRIAALESAATATLKSARSGYLPILSGTASVGYADRNFPPGGNVWGVGLNLTVPLFSGFSTVEQEREAAASLRGVEARKDNLKLQVVKEVESAWLGVKEAAARIESTTKEEEAAREHQALAMGRYKEGVGSIIEVTDAQSQALDAETAHIQAVYDYHTALARLDRAVGRE